MPSSSQKKTSFGTNSECRVFVVIADVVDLTWLYSAFWYLKKTTVLLVFANSTYAQRTWKPNGFQLQRDHYGNELNESKCMGDKLC